MKRFVMAVLIALGVTGCTVNGSINEMPGVISNYFPYGLTLEQAEGSITAGLLKMRWVPTDVRNGVIVAYFGRGDGVMNVQYAADGYSIEPVNPWGGRLAMQDDMADLDYYIQKYSRKAAIESAKIKMRGQ